MPPRARSLAAVPDPVGPMLTATRDTLKKLDAEPKDEGLRRLAEHYARAVDEARMIAVDARQLLDASAKGDIDIPKRMLNALQKHAEATTVLTEVGPKLQAALEALGASPKARAQITGKGDKPDARPGQSSLDRRRAADAERRARAGKRGPSPVDSASS